MTVKYDKLSELINDELREALRKIDFSTLPRQKDGLRIVGLSNSHLFGVTGELILPEHPADAVIPHRYEGGWEKPLPELSPEPTRRLPLNEDPVIVRYGNCTAIYA